MRVPPMGVTSTTIPGGVERICPMRAASAPSGWAWQGGKRGIRLRRSHHRHQLPLVGNVERVDPEQLAGRGHRRPHRQVALVQHHREVGVPGQLVADRSRPRPGWRRASTWSQARRPRAPRRVRSEVRCRTRCRRRGPGHRGPASPPSRDRRSIPDEAPRRRPAPGRRPAPVRPGSRPPRRWRCTSRPRPRGPPPWCHR